MTSILNQLKKTNNIRRSTAIAKKALTTDDFKQQLAFLKTSQWWPEKQLKNYQLSQLQKVVSFAYENVPYYRYIFNKNNLLPSDIKTLKDIKKIPLLTKKTIKKNYDRFIAKTANKKELLYRTTGGSTGNPLIVMADLQFLSKDKANTIYYLDVASCNPFRQKSIRLYGDKIPQAILKKGKYWYISQKRQLVMSCYHISEQTIKAYLKQINSFQPHYIHTRPSAIYSLAKLMADYKLRLTAKINKIFCDGEILYLNQRRLIEKVFACPVYNVYGHTEGCAVGISCPYSRFLHFLPQVGILELLDKNHQDVRKEGERGEIVVSGFNNYVFPLLRYRTKDIGVKTLKKCPCGRKYSLLTKVEGRIQNYVVNNKKILVPLSPAIFNYNDMDWKGISSFQVTQQKIGKLLFNIVLEKNFQKNKKTMVKKLEDSFNKIFGRSFKIKIAFVNKIPRTKIGKYRYLNQKLNLKKYAKF